jgi:hypothetical protein
MSRYDITKLEPPYEFVQVGEFEIDEANDDGGKGTGGIMLYAALCRGAANQGKNMQSYSLGRSPYKYDVVVRLTYKEWPHCPDGYFGCYCGDENLTKHWENL